MIATPAIALSASPARVAIAPQHTEVLHVTNTGRSPAVVLVARAGFVLAPRGRPRVVARAKPPWLRVRPARLRLAAGETGALRVTAGRAEPGDHPALLLLRTRPLVRAGVAVRMQIGVVVVLRVPGAIVHDLRLVRVGGHAGRLVLVVANRGNVTERLASRPILLVRRGRIVGRMVPRRRELLPHSTGIVELGIPPSVRGPLTVAAFGRRVLVPSSPRARGRSRSRRRRPSTAVAARTRRA